MACGDGGRDIGRKGTAETHGREGVGAVQRVRTRGYETGSARSNCGSAVLVWHLQQGEVAYVAFAVVR